MTRAAGIATLAAALLAVGGCGGAAATRTVVVDALAFGPAPEGLRVGDTVVWVNHDAFQHSATAHDGAFDIDLPAGGQGRLRLSRPGAFRYFCRYHPGMTGVLRVAAGDRP